MATNNQVDWERHRILAESDEGPLKVTELVGMMSECSPGGDKPMQFRKLVVLLNRWYKVHYKQ